MSDPAELVPIREAARRLNVSDTAVRKAISAGRVRVAGRHPKNGRPLLEWPACEADWHRNTDSGRRTHVGPRGDSRHRAVYASDTPIAPISVDKAPTLPEGDIPPDALDAEAAAGSPAAPSYAQSRAIREAYQARLAKLEYEERSGKLVAADAVKTQAFKVARSVRDALMNIPDRVASELAAETSPAAVHARLARELRDAIRELAEVSLPGQQAQRAPPGPA